MSDPRQMIEWAQNADAGEIRTRIQGEAARRGHPQQTAFAGAGGLLGGLLGSFRGPLGAALGGLLGALFGALVGWQRDQRRTAAQLPASTTRHRLAVPQTRLRPRVEVEPDYVDVQYRSR